MAVGPCNNGGGAMQQWRGGGDLVLLEDASAVLVQHYPSSPPVLDLEAESESALRELSEREYGGREGGRAREKGRQPGGDARRRLCVFVCVL